MKKYSHKASFTLENGAVLPGLEISYHAYGELRPGTPVIWVCHALTANSDVFDWWKGLFGPGTPFDGNGQFIVCANVLGGCYGTTGPLSIRPGTGSPWYHDWPSLTIRDMVKAHRLLASHLGIQTIDLLIGGSLGGQQALEWAVEEPVRIRHLALIATNAQHSAWGIAFNESQRLAIAADPTWQQRHPEAGFAGLRAARAVALLSYRNYDAYHRSQFEEEPSDPPKAVTYQRYQGEKLVARFNAFSYISLSHAMDSHHIGRKRGSISQALQQVRARALVIGIRSDILFPLAEQELLAREIPDARFEVIDSPYGHDGFLIETTRLASLLTQFLAPSLQSATSLSTTPL